MLITARARSVKTSALYERAFPLCAYRVCVAAAHGSPSLMLFSRPVPTLIHCVCIGPARPSSTWLFTPMGAPSTCPSVDWIPRAAARSAAHAHSAASATAVPAPFFRNELSSARTLADVLRSRAPDRRRAYNLGCAGGARRADGAAPLLAALRSGDEAVAGERLRPAHSVRAPLVLANARIDDSPRPPRARPLTRTPLPHLQSGVYGDAQTRLEHRFGRVRAWCVSARWQSCAVREGLEEVTDDHEDAVSSGGSG
jgi:hypothetical protein